MYLSLKFEPVRTNFRVVESYYENGEFTRIFTRINDSLNSKSWHSDPDQIILDSRKIQYCSNGSCSDLPRDSLKLIFPDQARERLITTAFQLPLKPLELSSFVQQGYVVMENSTNRLELSNGSHHLVKDKLTLTESEYAYHMGDTSYWITSYQVLPDGTWFRREVMEGVKSVSKPEEIQIRSYSDVYRTIYRESQPDNEAQWNNLTAVHLGNNRFEFRFKSPPSEKTILFIYDQLGRQVQEITILGERALFQLDLPPGNYWIKTSSSHKSQSFTITQ